jgi:hypothetical protein
MRKARVALTIAGIIAIQFAVSAASHASGKSRLQSFTAWRAGTAPTTHIPVAMQPEDETPIIGVSPTVISAKGDRGGAPVTVDLTIANGGDLDLDWEITESAGGTSSNERPDPTQGKRYPVAASQERATLVATRKAEADGRSDTPSYLSLPVSMSNMLPNGSADCGPSVQGIIIDDDGVPENGASAPVERAYVQRFTPSAYPATFTSVCVSYFRTRPPGPNVVANFEVVVFDATGENGAPGKELGAVAATTTDIQEKPDATFVNVDISALNLNIASGSVYIGVRNTLAAGIWFAWDESLTTPLAPAYQIFQPGAPWTPPTDLFPAFRSFLIRPVESGCIAPTDVPWLSVSPSSGTSVAGASSHAMITLDPGALEDGYYAANVCIASNDLAHAKYTVPVQFTVGQVTPLAGVTPDDLAFTVETGKSDASDISIANTGTFGSQLAYTITEAAGDCGEPADIAWLSAIPVAGAVDIDDPASVTVQVNAAGLAPGAYAANLCVSTNDATHALFTIPVALSVSRSNFMFRDGFDGPAELVVDDGTPEDFVALQSGGEFIWLNRFTPDATQLPLELNQVQVYWPNQGFFIGASFDVYVYTDADGDPSNGATLVASATGLAVSVLEDFQTIDITPVALAPGDGDVLIAVVNRDGMIRPDQFPAAIDETLSENRSWVGTYVDGTVADPPVLPPDSLFGTVEAYSQGTISGNWMIRGLGTLVDGKQAELR